MYLMAVAPETDAGNKELERRGNDRIANFGPVASVWDAASEETGLAEPIRPADPRR